MFWKILIGVSIVAIITGGAVWIAHGMNMFTHDRDEVITVVKDEIFGTEREEITWVENYRLGLLPDDYTIDVIHHSYAFILGVSGAAILLSLFMLKRQRKG
jgi:hypothetical protein